jgi:hypothetical protein
MTVPSVPSQASIPCTASSQLPVGGTNSAFLRLAGGVVEAGCWAFFRGFLPFGLLSGVDVAVAARPLFFVFGSFFLAFSPRIASRPPTLFRYLFKISSADGLCERTISRCLRKEAQMIYEQKVLFWLPGHIRPLLVTFPFDVVHNLTLNSKISDSRW